VVVPPPPPPPPPFPALKGMMNVGDGLIVLFSEKAGGTAHASKVGEPVGQFTLKAVNEKEVVLAWNNQEFHKTVAELMDRSVREDADVAKPVVNASAPPPPVIEAPKGPGVTTGETTKACLPGDTMDPGTVVDGFKKVVIAVPFGKACRWEAVGR
jgi:hypothetical protein